MQPHVKLDCVHILGVAQIGEVGSLLEKVAVDLVEDGGLISVEEGVGVGQIEESVVSEGQGS